MRLLFLCCYALYSPAITIPAATSKIMAQCFRLSFSLGNRRFHSTRAAQRAVMMGRPERRYGRTACRLADGAENGDLAAEWLSL